MKRLTVLLALVGSCLSLGLPAQAAGDAAYTGTMTWAQPVTPVESPNEWTFTGSGAGTLAPDQPSNFSYTGPLSLVVKGLSQNQSTLGGDTDVRIVQLSGETANSSVRLAKPPVGVRVRTRPGSTSVSAWVDLYYCNPFGCISVYQCITLTITYTVWPYPGASATTSKC